MLHPYRPQPAETFWLRRLITHPGFASVCIFAALVVAGANQWAHL